MTKVNPAHLLTLVMVGAAALLFSKMKTLLHSKVQSDHPVLKQVNGTENFQVSSLTTFSICNTYNGYIKLWPTSSRYAWQTGERIFE